jgi:hypothetical protein
MASRTSKAHDAEVCALSNEHTEVHAKRKKILGKGTGGREGYLLFFRQGLANLSAGPRQSNLQICSNHLQTSAEKVLNMNRTINSFLFQAYAPPYSKLP